MPRLMEVAYGMTNVYTLGPSSEAAQRPDTTSPLALARDPAIRAKTGI